MVLLYFLVKDGGGVANDRLTAKQERFVLGLVDGKSQRQAYLEAGYSTKNKSGAYLDSEACKLFKNPKVSTRYDELMQKLEDESILSAREVLKELSDVAKSSAADNDSFGARYRGASKLRALELLGKHHGVFADTQAANNNQVVIVNDLPKPGTD